MPLKASVGTTPWDMADYIEDIEDVRAHIEEAFASRSPAVIYEVLGAVARSKGMAAIAERAGLQRESLYKALAPTGNPEFATILKVLDAMGWQLALKPVGDAPTRSAPKPPGRTQRKKSPAAA